MHRFCLCFIIAMLAAGCGSSACPDGDQSPDGDTLIDGDADQTDQADSTDTSDDADGDFEIAPPELPRLTDWDCPPEWRSVPAFVDENGNEDVPEGMQQYHICEPPEYWSGPSGPVKLKSWECPAGWLPVVHEELTDENGLPFSWCEPPALPEECPEGFMPLIGQTECVHIGDPCPEGDFPEIPVEVTGRRIYIKEGSAGGDGTIGSPFGAINEALATAQAGDVLVIGPGRYREMVEPTTDVTIWGSCVENTIIDAPGPHDGSLGAVKLGSSLSVTLRNLRLTGSQNGVRVLGAGASLFADGLLIERATRNGIWVTGGQLDIIGSCVDGTAPDPDGARGRGMVFDSGGSGTVAGTTIMHNMDIGILAFDNETQVAIADSSIHQNRTYGIWLENGPRLSASRVLVSDNGQSGITTVSDSPEVNLIDTAIKTNNGPGIWMSEATITGIRVVITDNVAFGLFAERSGTEAHLTDSIIYRTTLANGSLDSGGIWLEDAAALVGERIVLSKNDQYGLFASGLETLVEVQDAVLDSTQGIERELDATPVWVSRGINLQSGVELRGTRLLLSRNQESGISAHASFVNVSDSVVRETQCPEGSEMGAWGLVIQGGSEFTATRMRISANHYAGIVASGAGTRLSFDSVLLDHTRSVTSGNPGGKGISVQDKAECTGRRMLLNSNQEVGMLIHGAETRAEMHDIVVRDTRRLDDGRLGDGVQVTTGATLTGSRMLIYGNRDAGVVSADAGTVVSLTDSAVLDTKSLADGSLGRGFAVQSGGSLNGLRLLIDGNRHTGLFAYGASTRVGLEDAIVRETYSTADGRFGRGIVVQDGAVLDGRRIRLARNREAGLFAAGPGVEVTLSDADISDTLSMQANGTAGRGVNIQNEAVVNGERIRLSGNRDTGVYVFHSGSRATLHDVEVTNTLLADCALLPEGHGGRCVPAGMEPISREIGAFCGGMLSLDRFRVTRGGSDLSTILGVQIGYGTIPDGGSGTRPCTAGGNITLSSGEVSKFEIGASIQVTGYDMTTIKDNVIWDNRRNLSSDDLPLPDATALTEEGGQMTIPGRSLELPGCPLSARPPEPLTAAQH